MFLSLPPNSRIYIAFYLWATKANHTSAFNQAAPGVVDAQDRAEGAGREQRGFGRERSFGTADFPFPRPGRPRATAGLSPFPPPVRQSTGHGTRSRRRTTQARRPPARGGSAPASPRPPRSPRIPRIPGSRTPGPGRPPRRARHAKSEDCP